MPPLEERPRSSRLAWTPCLVLAVVAGGLGYLVLIARPRKPPLLRPPPTSAPPQRPSRPGRLPLRKTAAAEQEAESRSGIQRLHHRGPPDPGEPESQRHRHSIDGRRGQPREERRYPRRMEDIDHRTDFDRATASWTAPNKNWSNWNEAAAPRKLPRQKPRCKNPKLS